MTMLFYEEDLSSDSGRFSVKGTISQDEYFLQTIYTFCVNVDGFQSFCL